MICRRNRSDMRNNQLDTLTLLYKLNGYLLIALHYESTTIDDFVSNECLMYPDHEDCR